MTSQPKSTSNDLLLNLELITAKDPSSYLQLAPIACWLRLLASEGLTAELKSCWNPRWKKIFDDLNLAIDTPEPLTTSGFGMFTEEKPLWLRFSADRKVRLHDVAALGPVHSLVTFREQINGQEFKIAQIGDKYYVTQSQSSQSGFAILVRQHGQLEAWIADPSLLTMERA